MSKHSSDSEESIVISPPHSTQASVDVEDFSWYHDGPPCDDDSLDTTPLSTSPKGFIMERQEVDEEDSLEDAFTETQSKTSFKIRLPAKINRKKVKKHAKKVQRKTVDSDSETALPPLRAPKSTAKRQSKTYSARRSSCEQPTHSVVSDQSSNDSSDSESGSERTSSSESEPLVLPRKRGRPCKAIQDKSVAPKMFAVPVYIEVATPPKFKAGRTHKGDRMVQQPPKKKGPFTLLHSMTWETFMESIATVVDEEIENLLFEEMEWSLTGKKDHLPLTDEAGYTAMVAQLQKHKNPVSQVVIVYLPLPKLALHKAKPMEECEDDNEGHHGRWDQKLSLDKQLAPIISALEGKYPIGACAIHPTLRCFESTMNGWHFDLNRNRLQVWANAILRKSADIDRAPLGANFFMPKDRLDATRDHFSGSGPQTPKPGLPHNPYAIHPPWLFSPSPAPPMSPSFHPFMSLPTSYPAMPWGFHPSFMPLGQTQLSAAHPSSPLTSIQNTMATVPQLTPSGMINSVSSIPEPVNGIESWCTKHGLGDEERHGLTKLGFRIGDDLGALPADSWEWAGLAPCHRQRILAAYEKDHSG